MSRDFANAEIAPGDVVFYVSGGRYTRRGMGVVTKVKKSVYVEFFSTDGYGLYDGWLSGASCIVIEKAKADINHHLEGKETNYEG